MSDVTETTVESAVDKKNETNTNEEYAYLDRGGFSSEKFKIELRGLPKFYGIVELKKLMNQKLNLNASKIKRPKHGSQWLFACFQNDEERIKAIEVLNGYVWKGKKLMADVAKPAPDPLVRKRKKDENTLTEGKKKKEHDEISQEQKLKDATTPYWDMPYDEQVKLKEKEIKQLLMKFDNEVWKIHIQKRSTIETNRKLYDGLSFELRTIQKSPITDGYRNKCEFTVGVDEETKLPTVGFRLGSYATGTVGVAPVEGLLHIPERTKRAVLLFQDFIRKSELLPFSPADFSGYWRYLTVRNSTSTGDVMLIVAMHPQALSESELQKIKDDLINHFSSEEAVACGIKSLYFELITKRRAGEDASKPVHLMGSTHIIDTILERQFRISPEAFFQINTAGAEILYQSAIDMSQVNKDSTVVDICCGTGTIGLCFAKYCNQVLGLEIIQEAVRDAKANAALNNIENCDFFTGKAEDILPSVLARATGDDIIAIVDPPRAGLHMRAITQLRNTKKVKRLVYISCSPSSAVKNFVDLSRPSSKTLRGAPFVPVRAVPVDMFPHTKHVELAILFERDEVSNEDEDKVAKNEETATSDEIKMDEVEIKVEDSTNETNNRVLIVVFSLICSYFSFTISDRADLRFAESESVLDPKGELLMKWRIDYSAQKIQFQIAMLDRAPAFNWFALGFSDRGELNNSDVCLFWSDYKCRDHFEDMHADDEGRLIRDAKQDCDGFYLDTSSQSIIFERNFDTCDDDDYVIEDGTVHVVWAHGVDKLFSSQGLCLTCTSPSNHGFIRVRLLTPSGLKKANAYQLKITNKDLHVPGGDTTYWCKVVKLPEFIIKKIHHIIQFESTITQGNEGLVHHMEVFYCDAGAATDIPLYEGNCFANDRPEITKTCSKVKSAWAMGAPPFTYPKEAGLPLGGPDANKYLMLEVHYNNPELRKDWVDSSGIIMHVTGNRRKYDAAIMELGLEYTDKMAIPGGQKAFALSGYCIPQCTGVGLPQEGIVVFGSQLHTHLTGISVWTRHSRHGIELPILNKDIHYSTHFQEIRILHRPVRVLPGDFLETTCVYSTVDKVNATVGGHAITDEMCVNYMHYYPATELEVCKSAISNVALENYFKFEREWDNMSISYEQGPRMNYIAISPWTPLRVKTLQALYTESPISMQCNKSDGSRFQGDWEGMTIPKIRIPLPVEQRICPDINNRITAGDER
ncbi:hypothetical protein K1T71_007671 [Dendrolimus kikuchii]|uniref:Uncharacterized protein n=1 Tax=Dendrolimus kikuchii TaxID=765133 RepID=A0ACC1CY23_9NEOP|nr:hypothetical protein K1T71_007671 [Dendrolimus kikuchii]